MPLATAAALGPVAGASLAAATAAVMLLAARRISRTLGGLTGDAYGALIEIGDLTALLGFLAILRLGIPASWPF